MVAPDRLDKLCDFIIWNLEVGGFLPDQAGWTQEGFYRDRLHALLREVLGRGVPDLL